MFLLCILSVAILSFVVGMVSCMETVLKVNYALAVEEGRTKLSYEAWVQQYKKKLKNVDTAALQKKVKMLNK